MQCRVLGSLEVLGPQGWETPAAPKRRRALAALVLAAGEVVTVDRLSDAIWGEGVPASAAKIVQNHVLGLRRSFGSEAITTRAGGYCIDRDELTTDAYRFEAIAHDGRRALDSGRFEQAVAFFSEALTLWRGDPYPDLASWGPAVSESARLDELHALVEEDALQARIESGAHLQAVGDLEAAVAKAPLRERRWCLLMLALYRSERQAHALAAYQRARGLLIEELGVEPGSALAAMERAVLAQDRALDNPVANVADTAGVETPTSRHERAAAVAAGRGEYAEAVRLWRAALAAHAEHGDGSREAEFLVRLGTAERLAGDDAHRATLRRAFDLALRSDDARVLISAALAGVQRAGARRPTVVDDDLEALLEVALERGPREPADRAKLASALAQELTASPDPVRRRALADQALADARRARDPATLSEVLSRRAVTLAGPEALDDRLATTFENVLLSAHLRDPIARWAAIRTRLHAVLQSGDLVEAEQRLTQLRSVTAETGAVTAEFGLAVDEAARLLLAGQVDAAESMATDAYTLGAADSHPDAFALYSGQLLEVRRAQGRLGELEGVIDAGLAGQRERS